MFLQSGKLTEHGTHASLALNPIWMEWKAIGWTSTCPGEDEAERTQCKVKSGAFHGHIQEGFQ